MKWIRRFYRLILAILWMIALGCVSFFACLGGWGAIKRVSYFTRIWGWGIAKILNLKIKVVGDVGDFKGGLIVSNHTGYLDILVHAALFPIRFAPNTDIKGWPVLGWYLATSRPIWIDRSSRTKSRKTFDEFKETMNHHIPLIVYPEGTSTSGDDGLLPFKSTPFAAVAESGHQILPLITRFERASDGFNVAWYGDQTLLPHVWQILGYKELKVQVNIMPTITPESSSRKELAQQVRRQMEDLYWELQSK